MSDKAPSEFKRVYALRREILFDVEGYVEFLKERDPDTYAYALEVGDQIFREQVAAALRARNAARTADHSPHEDTED